MKTQQMPPASDHAPVHSLSGRDYAVVSLVIGGIGGTLLVLYVWCIPYLVANGIQHNVFYILLLPWGMASAGFLFGVMRGYAHITHRQLGNKIELGGPAAMFVLVVVGGFILTPNEDIFTLTLRAHAANASVLNVGKITIQIDDSRRTEPFREDGDATFKGIPHRFWGNQIRVLPQIDGYASEWMTITIDSHAIDLTLRPAVGHMIGQIVPVPQDPAAMLIILDDGNAKGKPDERGKFDIPVSSTTGTVRIQVFLQKKLLYDSYQTIPGPVTISLNTQ